MFVFKPRRKANGKPVPAAHYSGRFRLAGEIAWRTVPLHVTDKEVARQKLAGLVRLMEREAAGLDAPRAATESAQRDLLEHLTEFLGT